MVFIHSIGRAGRCMARCVHVEDFIWLGSIAGHRGVVVTHHGRLVVTAHTVMGQRSRMMKIGVGLLGVMMHARWRWLHRVLRGNCWMVWWLNRGSDLSVLSPAFNSFVAILVKSCKILPNFSILLWHIGAIRVEIGKLERQFLESLRMKLILMWLVKQTIRPSKSG